MLFVLIDRLLTQATEGESWCTGDILLFEIYARTHWMWMPENAFFNHLHLTVWRPGLSLSLETIHWFYQHNSRALDLPVLAV